MNFIDAHSHVWTPDTQRYPLAGGFRRANMDPPSFTTDELAQQAIPVGVNRVVLIQMSFYGYDNSYMLDAIARNTAMYRGVAVINEDDPQVAAIMRSLRQRGVTGFRIYPKDRPVERWLSSDGMRKMWATAAEQKQSMCCLIDPDALPALDAMCLEYPDTPVVIDHICRIGVSGKIEPTDVESLCKMARHKRLTVKVSAFYALGQKKAPYTDLIPLIKRVYDAFGAQRLMWASDAPFQVVGGHSYKSSIDLIQSKLDFLKADEMDWLLRKTAESVFFS